MAATVEAFVEEHSDAEMLPSGKVRCTTTGHEMAAKVEACEQHWSGNKYKNAKARSRYDFTQHEPWIVQNKKDPYLLFCMLTKQPLCKLQKVIEGHVQGKRYKRLLKEAQEGKQKPTGKRQLKKRMRNEEKDTADGEDGGKEAGGDDEGEEEDEDEDGGDGGDAAEFLAEGAFWDREEEEEPDQKGEQLDEDDEEETFWTRPKIQVGRGASKKDRKKEAKRLKSAEDAPAPTAKATKATKPKITAASKPNSGSTAAAQHKAQKAKTKGEPSGKRVRSS